MRKKKNNMTDENQNHQEPVIRDKRRINPETGAVRQPEDPTADVASVSPETMTDATENTESDITINTDEGYEGPDIETSLNVADLDFLSGQTTAEQLAADRLADLQRITAEYANYRKRTEANRETEQERAIGEAAKVLLPVLDDLDRAEKHGDLHEGGSFATIAGKLRAGAEKLGLKPFVPVNDPFDPAVHEAIFQQPSLDVTAPTVAEVVETGYYLGSTLLRAAKVVVAVPNG
jgi:molecular chaperone GrpE